MILPEARRGHQRILSAKGSLNTAQGEQEQPEALHTERHRVRRRVRTKGSVPQGTEPRVSAPPSAPEDDPDLQDIDPSLWGDTEEVPRREPEVSSLEPRSVALPLPGQEVSRATPQYQRML